MQALLHGGFKGLPENAWHTYFAEIFRGGGTAFTRSKALNIVLVPWANSPKQWRNIAQKLAERCEKYWADMPCHIYIAHTPEDLIELSPKADIIYCHGGIFIDAMTRGMQQTQTVLKESNAKVFTGFSAGAYGLVTTYYNAKNKAAAKGGGLFEAAVCCHYNPMRAGAQKILKEGAQKQNPHLLADGDFVWL